MEVEVNIASLTQKIAEYAEQEKDNSAAIWKGIGKFAELTAGRYFDHRAKKSAKKHKAFKKDERAAHDVRKNEQI